MSTYRYMCVYIYIYSCPYKRMWQDETGVEDNLFVS